MPTRPTYARSFALSLTWLPLRVACGQVETAEEYEAQRSAERVAAAQRQSRTSQAAAPSGSSIWAAAMAKPGAHSQEYTYDSTSGTYIESSPSSSDGTTVMQKAVTGAVNLARQLSFTKKKNRGAAAVAANGNGNAPKPTRAAPAPTAAPAGAGVDIWM